MLEQAINNDKNEKDIYYMNIFSYLFDENVNGQFYTYRKMGYKLMFKIA